MVSVPETSSSVSPNVGLDRISVSSPESIASSPTKLQIMAINSDVSSPAESLGTSVEDSSLSPTSTLEHIKLKDKPNTLPVKPITPNELASITLRCPACPESRTTSYSLANFFQHQYDVHKLISCVYCAQMFHTAKEVVVHLYREHHLICQKFETEDEFIRRGGGRTTVLCVDCETILEITPDASDQNLLTTHQCKFCICPDCGVTIELGSLEEHLVVCGIESVQPDPTVTSNKLVGYCKFCMRKIDCRDGEDTCTLCQKIGVNNLVVKSPSPLHSPPKVKARSQYTQLRKLNNPPTVRKTKKQIPPLIPANFGSSTSNSQLTSSPDAHSIANMALSSPEILPTHQDTITDTPDSSSELTHLNFSSSITVTPIIDDCTGDGDLITTSIHKPNHSVLSQESTDLKRPKRSLKRVTNEDFMYGNKLKRRVVTSAFSIPHTSLQSKSSRGALATNDEKEFDKSDKTYLESPIHFENSTENLSESIPINTDDEKSKPILLEKTITVPVVKLDPLLLESDSVKRIDILISELTCILLNGRKKRAFESCAGQEFFEFELLLDKENVKSGDSILNRMIENSSSHCDYCRQVKLIRIDKRQLVLHLLRQHDWSVRLQNTFNVDKVAQDSETKVNVKTFNSIQEVASINDQVKTAFDNEAEVPKKLDDCLSTEIVNKDNVVVPPNMDTFKSTSTDANSEAPGESLLSGELDQKIPKREICDGKVLNENFETALHEKSSVDKVLESTETITSDEILCRELAPNENSQNNQTSAEDLGAADTPFGNSSHDVYKAGVKVELENDKIKFGEFTSEILKKVFESDRIVFTYSPSKYIKFGEVPCECLICGFQAESQVALFPHWRKSHRATAMKCPMCHGNFLFAGALFSHICLGTPQHFATHQGGGKIGVGEKPESELLEARINGGLPESQGGTTNDTIALRYQCGLCDDLQLPGFFNYMVHVRRDHIMCELCLESVSTQRDLEHHMKKHKLNHFCWKCSITYLSKPNFMTHLFWKHGTESRDCSVCLKKKWPHIYHYCISPPWFTCDVCGLYFTNTKSLRVHKRLHDGRNLRSCTHCEEKFISASLLAKHLANEHNPDLTEALSPKAEIKLNGHDSKLSDVEDMNKRNENTVPSEIRSAAACNPMDPIASDTVEKSDLIGVVENSDFGQKNSSVEVDSTPNGNINDNLQSQINLEEADVVDSGVKLDTESISIEKAVGEVGDIDSEKKQIDDIPEGSDPFNATESKKTRRKRRKNSGEFQFDSVLGPELSEDESSSGSSSSSSSENESEGKFPGTSQNRTSDKELENAVIQQVPDTPLASLTTTFDAATNGEISRENQREHKFLAPYSLPFAVKSAPPPFITLDCNTIDFPTVRSTLELPGATPRLDLSSTATAMLFDDDGVLLLPTLTEAPTPLEVFNMNAPEEFSVSPTLPTFGNTHVPDHILREHLVKSVLLDHPYCLSYTEAQLPSAPLITFTGAGRRAVAKRPLIGKRTGITKRFANSMVLKKPKPTIAKPRPLPGPKPKAPVRTKLLPGRPKTLSQPPGRVKYQPPPSVKGPLPAMLFDGKRKRKRSGSSSSSSSSSSCSSCGSNCSCSSGSSSSSSTDSDDSSNSTDSDTHPEGNEAARVRQLPVKRNIITSKTPVMVVPKKRGRKPKPKVEQPPKIKRPKGRPPKANKSKNSVKPLTALTGLGVREADILRHFKNTSDAFILEEDLQTSDSETDEIFNKKQITDSIIYVPSFLEDPWTAGNEKFLLNEVRGVRNLEELQPKPMPSRTPGIHNEGFADRLDQTIAEHNPVNVWNYKVQSKDPNATTMGMSVNLTSNSFFPNADCTSSFGIDTPSGRRTPSNSSRTSETSLTPSAKNRKVRGKVAEIILNKAVATLDGTVAHVPEPEMKLYCICQGPHDSVSQMIGCDAKDCPYQWFHFECVGIVVAPKGKWFCSDCRLKRRQKILDSKNMEFPIQLSSSTASSPVAKTSDKSARAKGYTNTFIGHTVI